MDGEAYSDFVLLFLLAHESRVEAEVPEECWLERWNVEAQAQGTRALDHLRDGVEAAIAALGTGFLAHPANAALRSALQQGAIRPIDYYRQLLRVIYRLLFLLVAESATCSSCRALRPSSAAATASTTRSDASASSPSAAAAARTATSLSSCRP